jgi:hypothetical protein
MVVNGATKFGDMEHFKKHLEAFKAKGGDVSMEYLHEQNLIALQGRSQCWGPEWAVQAVENWVLRRPRGAARVGSVDEEC